MLGDMAYDGDGLREELDQRGNQAGHSKPPKQKALLGFNKRLCCGELQAETGTSTR